MIYFNDFSVGKTQLINRYIYNTNELREVQPSYSKKVVFDGKTIKLDVMLKLDI